MALPRRAVLLVLLPLATLAAACTPPPTPPPVTTTTTAPTTSSTSTTSTSTTTSTTTTTVSPPTAQLVQLSTGDRSTCGRYDDGTVRCWGWLLGGGRATNLHDVLPITGIHDATDVEVGGFHACALLADATVRCWGLNSSYAVLGNGTPDNVGDGPNEMGANLHAVELGTGITPWALATGTTNSCVIGLSPAKVKCWGSNQYGELALGTSSTNLIGDSASEMGANLGFYDLGGAPVAIARVEQLYPWPYEGVASVLEKYSGADEIVWLQEEPENMGAWNHIKGRLYEAHEATHRIRRMPIVDEKGAT